MTTTAAIYARFSSDLQRDRSIEDQVSLCRDYAARQGYKVVATYDDRARSGASMFGRDGLMALMDAAKAGAFKVVVVEALDRLSRDQEDLAGLYKRLQFMSVDILAVHDGRADQVQVGIRGLVGALYLQDLAHKVRRGMAGVIRDGRHAGGKAYGYRPQPGKPGEWEIVPEEAAIVRRIFEEYAGGKPPREIALTLNKEGVPAPRGRSWLAATITGNAARRNGIIYNEIYAGNLIWNRLRMVKDPDTGKRVSRLNPETEWQRQVAPHLQIVPTDLFQKVAALKQSKFVSHGTPRRQGRLLTGLLKCGCCGGGLSIKDKYKGRYRVICTRAKEGSTCQNTASYPLNEIEKTVVEGLKSKLGSKEAIACYIKAYNAERQRLAADKVKTRAAAESALATAQRRLDRAIDALINEELEQAEAAARVAALRTERNRLQAELDQTEEAPNIITLHPKAVENYLDAVAVLDVVLNDDSCDTLPEAARIIRELIDAVVVNERDADGKIYIEIKGHLAQLIGGAAYPQMRRLLGGSVVAEVRYINTPPSFCIVLPVKRT